MINSSNRIFIYASIAQSVEHAAVNRGVVGSSPSGGVSHFSSLSQENVWRSSQVVRRGSATP